MGFGGVCVCGVIKFLSCDTHSLSCDTHSLSCDTHSLSCDTQCLSCDIKNLYYLSKSWKLCF